MNANDSHPRIAYWKIWAALLALLAATRLAAEFNLGRFNIVAAMTIAAAKALLVLLYFMHLRYRARLTWLFAAAGFFWLAIMLALTMSDYVTRGVKP